METKIKTKPSDFTNEPMGSVFKNSESETIARSIMIILKRTGNEFRELPWVEYMTERIKDGAFSSIERPYFDKVLPYCVSAEFAKKFSQCWADEAITI